MSAGAEVVKASYLFSILLAVMQESTCVPVGAKNLCCVLIVVSYVSHVLVIVHHFPTSLPSPVDACHATAIAERPASLQSLVGIARMHVASDASQEL